MKIEPFGERIVVKVILPEETTKGGLLLPVFETTSNKGEVLDVGDDVKYVNKSDIVLFPLGTGTDFQTEKGTYKILNERDILGKIKDWSTING